MSVPYKSELEGYLGTESDVTVDRDGAPPLTGRVHVVNDDGCVIGVPEGPEGIRSTYVDYRDIRGVSTVDWDL